MRFELIDKVVTREPQRLVALKNVTAAEEYLGDHFPGFPVLPGVLMLEALVQAGRRLLAGGAADDVGAEGGLEAGVVAPEPLVLAQVRNIRYGSMVRPGQCLQVEVTLRREVDGEWEFDGVGRVEDQVAVQGRFRLAPLDTFDE